MTAKRGWRAALRRFARNLRRLALGLVLVIALGPPLVIGLYAVVPPPATPLMLLRLAEGEGLAYDWVPLEDIAPALPRAVIAAEDNLFCTHAGFDWGSLKEAVGDWAAGRRGRGASTLSMQTTKNLMLWPGRSVLRKGLEAYATLWLELLLPKRRILELYLNIAEWGPGIYGAEAAARHHFDRPAARLDRQQATLLAVSLPNPRQRSAGAPSDALRRQAAVIDRRIGQLGPLLGCAP